MEANYNKYNKYACACCGFFTIKEIKETCPVCFWEEDSFQEYNIDDDGGPNTVSLRVARENFRKNGIMDLKFKDYVRPPLQEELT
jgi:hypothetical protein